MVYESETSQGEVAKDGMVIFYDLNRGVDQPLEKNRFSYHSESLFNLQSAEEVVQRILEDKGFTIVNIEYNDDLEYLREHIPENILKEVANPVLDRQHIQNIASVTSFSEFQVAFQELIRAGVPDLFVFELDDREWFFVEVKDENDSLKESQIRWISDFEHIPVLIAVNKEFEFTDT